MSVFIIRFLPVIVFIILILIWYLLIKKRSDNPKKAPWFVFIIIAILMFGFTLVLFRFVQFGELPGGKYIPPKATEDGIEPGHVER